MVIVKLLIVEKDFQNLHEIFFMSFAREDYKDSISTPHKVDIIGSLNKDEDQSSSIDHRHTK